MLYFIKELNIILNNLRDDICYYIKSQIQGGGGVSVEHIMLGL